MKELLKKIWSVLTSKRFKAFYWSSFAMVLAGFLDLIVTELTAWDPNHTITVMAGLVIAQVTKALNNYSKSETV